MLIDCETCPGRPRACDGCVMELLAGTLTCANPSADGIEGQKCPIDAAISVFAATSLISGRVAQAARERVRAGQGAPAGSGPRLPAAM